MHSINTVFNLPLLHPDTIKSCRSFIITLHFVQTAIELNAHFNFIIDISETIPTRFRITNNFICFNTNTFWKWFSEIVINQAIEYLFGGIMDWLQLQKCAITLIVEQETISYKNFELPTASASSSKLNRAIQFLFNVTLKLRQFSFCD